MAAAHPPEFRPYRVALYAIFVAFTLTFIFLIGRSIIVDLYGQHPVSGLTSARPSAEACFEELGVLSRKLAARSGASVEPRGERDWNGFTREFEERFGLFHSRCVDQPPPDATQAVKDALADAADRLDAVRQHLSRCGEKGEEERADLDQALAKLGADLRAQGR